MKILSQLLLASVSANKAWDTDAAMQKELSSTYRGVVPITFSRLDDGKTISDLEVRANDVMELRFECS